MLIEMATRNYNQRKRAQQQELTRQRIVAATVELHEELGAARTTVSAVAKRAGVQRLTVYRHFPDDAALLEACTTSWLEQNPLPTAADWQDEADPLARAVAALDAFHAYYRRTARMWQSSYRDRDTVPALAERLELVERYLDGIADELTAPLQLTTPGHRLARVVVRHGLRFSTWRSLADEGLAERETAELLRVWLGGVLEADANA